jgi:hypothetical protein
MTNQSEVAAVPLVVTDKMVEDFATGYYDVMSNSVYMGGPKKLKIGDFPYSHEKAFRHGLKKAIGDDVEPEPIPPEVFQGRDDFKAAIELLRMKARTYGYRSATVVPVTTEADDELTALRTLEAMVETLIHRAYTAAPPAPSIDRAAWEKAMREFALARGHRKAYENEHGISGSTPDPTWKKLRDMERSARKSINALVAPFLSDQPAPGRGGE